MPETFSKFFNDRDSFGLTNSTKKSEVLHQPVHGKLYLEPEIKDNGKRLKAEDKFINLGSTLSRNVTIDEEVQCMLTG